MKPECVEAAANFIKENPGRTINKLVAYMEQKGLCSRLTTLKIVEYLKESGRIEDQKVRNSFHQLYFRDKNEFNMIDKELREIEILVDRMEVIHRNIQRNTKYGNRLSNLSGQFFDFSFCYQESIQIMLRSLLARTHDIIQPGNDSQILYTKITELLLKVTKQRYPDNILNEANILKNNCDSLTELKKSWKQSNKKDNYYVKDIGLINGLIKSIDNFRKDLS